MEVSLKVPAQYFDVEDARHFLGILYDCIKLKILQSWSAARSSGSGAGRQSGAGGGLNFYTDDAPGLKMSPVRP